ncbi:MAG: hypothetical protein QMD92_07415 [bacterium]|nr:hypothetical protein [bacterium]
MNYLKIFKICFIVLIASILVINVQGCGKKESSKLPTDPTKAAELCQKAEEALEKKNYQEAEKLYEEVLTIEPNNNEALFGSAMSSLINLEQNQKIKDLEKKINGEGKSLITARDNFVGVAGKTMASFVMSAVKDPIQASEIQDALDTDVIPAIDKALKKLGVIENSGSFKYIAKKKVYDTDKDYEIDLADIYALDSSMNIIRSILALLVSYNLDIKDYKVAKEDPLSIITSGHANYESNFLKLRSNFRIAQFRENILTAIEKARKSVESMCNETDSQEDDIIKKPSAKEKSDILTELKKGEDWLNYPMKENINGNIVTIDLKQLFVNPLIDIKEYLPSLEYGDPINKKDIKVKEFNLKDPTFKGLLPGMTNEQLKKIMKS